MASCTTFCARPERPEQTEKIITVIIKVFFRPRRFATAPKSMPPNADAKRVTEATNPAVAGLSLHSSMIVERTKA
jgi:hypothetical protein